MTNSETHEVVAAEAAAETEAGDAPKIAADMGTMFILDLLRQKREKGLRMKKDEMIQEMALKKKKQMEDAKHGKGAQPSTFNFGGFVGIQNLTSGELN